MAARSEAWVCGHSLAGTAGSNPAGGGIDILSVMSVVLSDTGLCDWPRFLVQRSPTKYICACVYVCVAESDQVEQ